MTGEGGDAAEEPSGLDAQLSGVERYAVKFLEAESADFTAEQLRIAEVRVKGQVSPLLEHNRVGILQHYNYSGLVSVACLSPSLPSSLPHDLLLQ